MAEYYRAERRRTSAESKGKTPYYKIFFRQLIAAIICFMLIKYVCPESLRKNLKAYTDYNININEKIEQGLKIFNQKKINGADTNETATFKS